MCVCVVVGGRVKGRNTHFFGDHISICWIQIGYVFALLHSINFRWLLIIPGFLWLIPGFLWLIDVSLRFFKPYIRYPIKILNYQLYTLRNSQQASLVALTLQSNIKNIQWGDYVYVNVPGKEMKQSIHLTTC